MKERFREWMHYLFYELKMPPMDWAMVIALSMIIGGIIGWGLTQ